MKKLLALVLALVMTLGLATVAANASFPDAADIDLTEAADVMAAVGVFKGDEKGNFAPKANLSRDAAAKLIAYLALGEKVAEALPAVKVFDDVPATHWAAKYIAYCADAGYIAGDGNGNFLPTGALTGYAFGKMVLCALGYDAQIEGFVGSAWTLKVAKLMEENKINKNVKGDASAVLTREQAAQYCLNALKADMVEYNDKSVISIGDVKIEQSSKASKRPNNDADTDVIGKNDDVLQLGEKLYEGDLVLNKNEVDDFGRPAHEWFYDKNNVCTVADKAAATFTAETKADAVASALKGYKVADSEDADTTYKINNTEKKYDDIYLDGTVDTDGTKTVAALIAELTANGRLVEVFEDDDVVCKIVAINFSNEEIDKVSTDKKTGDVTYTLSGGGKFVDYADEDKDDTIIFTTAPAEDDHVTVYRVGDKAYVYPTTKVEGAVTSTKGASKLTIGGTSYESNVALKGAMDEAESVFALTDKTAKVYIDQYGFVSAYKDAEDSGDKTMILADVYQTLSDGKMVWMAKGVTSSGEEKVAEIEGYDGVSLDVQDVVKYADADDDDKLELTKVNESDALGNKKIVIIDNDEGFKASDKKAEIADGVYGYFTSDVKVIFVKDNGKYTVSEGMQKIAADLDVYAILKKSSDDATYYIKALYVAGAASSASTSSDDVIFVKGTTGETIAKQVDGKNKTFYLYNAYLKGEKIDNFYSATNGVANAFYTKDVETETGAYLFEGNLYNETTGTAAVTGKITITAKVNAQNILTVGDQDFLVKGATFVNATGDDDAEVESISDLNDTLYSAEDEAYVAECEAYVMYNEKTGEASYVYITAINPIAA